MKIIRALAIAFSICIPVAAVASPSVRASCCMGDSCCPGCPFCPSGLHG